MSVRTGPWPAGTPAWVDVMVKDVEKSEAFYAGLFGWTFDEGSAEFGHYITANLGGAAAAGLSPTPAGMEDQPSEWTTYIAVDDLDATQTRIGEAGGTVLMPAMTIGDFGGMALMADPTGVTFGLWKSGTHTGVDACNEAGTLAWNDAMTADLDTAKTFYREVFGYTYTDLDAASPYATVELDGRTVGGIGALTETDQSPRWRAYFAVDDIAATCALVPDLGGTVAAEPTETPIGIVATLVGPSGETFAVIQPPAASDVQVSAEESSTR